MNTSRWLTIISWSTDSQLVAFAAGPSVVVIDSATSAWFGHEEQSSVTGLAFTRRALVVSVYGGIRILKISCEPGKRRLDESCLKLESSTFHDVGATSVQCVAVSPDAKCISAGCLGKVLRSWTFGRAGAIVDWVGFSGPVALIAWSSHGSMLAAMSATAICIIPKPRDKAPILCRGRGEPAPDGQPGTCPTFVTFKWCPTGQERLIAAAVRNGPVLIFDLSFASGAYPRICVPLTEISVKPGHLDFFDFACGQSLLVVGVSDTIQAVSLRCLSKYLESEVPSDKKARAV